MTSGGSDVPDFWLSLRILRLSLPTNRYKTAIMRI
jgi:hypothetical protein